MLCTGLGCTAQGPVSHSSSSNTVSESCFLQRGRAGKHTSRFIKQRNLVFTTQTQSNNQPHHLDLGLHSPPPPHLTKWIYTYGNLLLGEDFGKVPFLSLPCRDADQSQLPQESKWSTGAPRLWKASSLWSSPCFTNSALRPIAKLHQGALQPVFPLLCTLCQ